MRRLMLGLLADYSLTGPSHVCCVGDDPDLNPEVYGGSHNDNRSPPLPQPTLGPPFKHTSAYALNKKKDKSSDQPYLGHTGVGLADLNFPET